SFGVRSMSTLVVTKDVKVYIDPGVALGPTRYGLPPTEAEEKALELARKKIMEVCKSADIVVVTHYHYDHHPFPDDEEMYRACFKGKIVYAKDRLRNINASGKSRGRIFEKIAEKFAKEIEWADGKEVNFGRTKIEFSPAVWHGDVGSKVGKVIMVYIKEGRDSFLFGSDAQGLADPQALKWFLEKNPQFAIIDGYPTIFIGWRMKAKNFEKSNQHLIKALENTKVKTMILEHHIVRDIGYREKMKDVFDVARALKKKILTSAEFYNLENFFLEAWRKEIAEDKRKVDTEKYYKELFKKIKKLL
ncbi:MAG TPA: MBL fold metallo-hydrolase, partial [Candidatus Aenigmarchaeota archaeon]|nr:MBL fold metallo-hydrolase [Candidatus Aenigmarchaeota archaeon]